MIEKADIWQTEGSIVFKLRSKGMTKKNGRFVKQFENEFKIKVEYTPEDKSMTQTEKEFIEAGMASRLAEHLNQSFIPNKED